MAQKHCTSCGDILPVNARFCAVCGAPVNAEMKEKAAPKVEKAVTPKTKTRDIVIVGAALALIAVGYFAFRTPARPPVPPQQTEAHQGVGGADMSNAMQALQDLPTEYEPLVRLGNQTMDNGNYALAAECYRRALAINPESPDVRTDYGACLHGMGLPERAAEEFRKVLKSEGVHAIAHFNMGVVMADIGQTDSARVYWQKYLEIDPNGPAAQRARELIQTLEG